MILRARKTYSLGLLVIILAAAKGLLFPLATMGAELPGYAAITGATAPGPQWTDLFDSAGKIRDVTAFGGHSAGFVEDNISAGAATDMSKLVSDGVVDNGAVQAANDAGNTYVYRTTDAAGNVILFAGVEHLAGGGNASYIEIEFTQGHIKVWSGVPWEIHGERQAGDLAVHLNLIDGALHSVEFKRWTDGYQVLETAWPVAGQDCVEKDGIYAFCSGAPVAGLAATNTDVWDAWGTPVTVPAADRFTAVGINVGKLLGANPDFSGFTVRTPDDIAFGTGLLVRRD